jgi:hypothetical protein
VIDPEVRAAIARGPTRVLVELRLPDPAGSAPETVSARAETITAARQAVVAQLAGRTYRVLRQYTTVPLLALEIGPDALQVIGAWTTSSHGCAPSESARRSLRASPLGRAAWLLGDAGPTGAVPPWRAPRRRARGSAAGTHHPAGPSVSCSHPVE